MTPAQVRDRVAAGFAERQAERRRYREWLAVTRLDDSYYGGKKARGGRARRRWRSAAGVLPELVACARFARRSTN